MGWERTKATTMELPPEPSFMGWLLAGGVAAVVGALLFILHASGMVEALAAFNIWWLASSPVLGWFFLFCLRGWLWGRTVDEHQFLQKEAEYGQQQWESWAGRYLAVLGSSILLPSGVTSYSIAKSEASDAAQLLSLTSHFVAPPVTFGSLLELGLAGVQNAIAVLPVTVPLNITVVSDNNSAESDSLLRKVWGNLYPDRAISGSVSFCEILSFAWVEERLKKPVLDIDLILILQQHGAERYSDALASMLLTSDDVAEKYQLPHSARILRPMPLDMTHFKADMRLFLETQTIACQTSKVFCDYGHWNDRFAELMTASQPYQTPWVPQEIDVLEKYNGIPGAGSAWLLAALLSDITLVSQTPVLGLFTSGTDRFVSTVTSGSNNNDAG
ncbi:hypothetical protein EDC48_108142 [Gibbsiella quercinecans]|uniref:Type VI secretion protein n=1 Tax=Gibbsiella quercinecans TaxID=929813 RepID=A0A250B5G1_9GAMM|nr:hypothetical protein [Gibbsiella quercinecans]ATA21316.1 hypothetical protein AWC35_19345 [Gibbsiella quercinecans]RLM13487.1 hypothetical protein BIY30_05165 [Gibbsiella quercinecans]TCT88560.1 hypothetical protein EDC48_108142 [Gibbsiella quercinecans]